MSTTPDLPEDDEAWTALLRTLQPQGPSAEPRPFFYTRLEARLLAGQPPALPWWLRRPAYAATLAGLVLVLNTGAALYYLQQHSAAPAAPPETGYTAFAAEYQLDPFLASHE